MNPATPIKTLEQVRYEAARRAVAFTNGNFTQAAKDLGIKRQTLTAILDRMGEKTEYKERIAPGKIIPLARVAALISVFYFLLSALPGSAQVPPHPLAMSAAAPQPPKGITVAWRWNHATNPVASYRIFTTTNRISPDWQLVGEVGFTNFAIVSNVTPPMWFVARAVADAGESTNSNIVGVLGWDAVLTVWSEVSSSATGGFRYLAPVATETNPVGREFFRLGASVTNRLRIE